MSELHVAEHPSLVVRHFFTNFSTRLGELPSPEWLVALLDASAPAPVQRSEELRGAVRDMLRFGGYKPTGRGKPASEYLVKAADEGGIRSINPAVDACNAVSLHSGFPISVIDADRARPPFRIDTPASGDKYVFNPAGQEIDIGGLVCIFDADGPCGNAVKDSQRTKTNEDTRATLSVIWGCKGFEAQLNTALEWYQEILKRATGAAISSTPAPR
jgi:DNA/RNA-binding domain of Phe-tRNA-synthetase-like protein